MDCRQDSYVKFTCMCWPSIHRHEKFKFRLDKPNPAFDVLVLQYSEILAKLTDKGNMQVNLVLKTHKKFEKVTVLFRRKHFIISVVANRHSANKKRESDFNFVAKIVNILVQYPYTSLCCFILQYCSVLNTSLLPVGYITNSKE